MVGVLLALLAGCSAAVDGAASPMPPTDTASAPTTTADPLADYPADTRAFIEGFTAAGFTLPGGNAAIARYGELVCADIASGARPAQTQALLVTSNVTAEEAAKVYALAHDTLCPSTPLPDPNTFGEGTYEVGVDIQPGKYRSPGGDGCYWERLAKDQNDIIDNDLTSGPSVFTVAPSDGFVRLSRCMWTKVP